MSPEKTAEEDYYIRGIDPSKGQALSYGSLNKDSGTLSLEKPLNNESRICQDWVQFFPDSLPEYLLDIVNEINFSLTYKDINEGNMGVQRISTYDAYQYNKNVSILSTNDALVSGNFDFRMNWTMNYFWEWYWQSIKLSSPNGNPQVEINPENPDIAKFTYVYPSTPAIKEIDNEKLIILAATMNSSDSNEASVIISGEGYANITLEMPNKNVQYVATYNGTDCNDANCKINYQDNGILSFTLNLGNDIDDLEIRG